MRPFATALLVLLLRAAPSPAQPQPVSPDATGGAPEPPAPREPVVCVRGDDAAGVADVVTGLVARGLHAVPCTSASGEAWVVDVRGLAAGEVDVAVRSAGALVWRPAVDVDPAADRAGRARAATVTAAAVLRLVLETQPAPVEPPVDAVEGVAPPSSPPPASPSAPSPWTWLVGAAFGAEGDIGGSATRRRVGVDLGLRVEAIHDAGAWLAGQLDWTIAWADRDERLLLETATPRLLAGASLGVDPWAVRFGLGGAFEGWWTAGGDAPSGWRLGMALAASFAWQALPWLAVGAEAGVDAYRTRVEIDRAGEPVFGLDHWRWRAGAWLAGTFGGG